jgi:hypothetical protein
MELSVEHLLSMLAVMGSIPSTGKNTVLLWGNFAMYIINGIAGLGK